MLEEVRFSEMVKVKCSKGSEKSSVKTWAMSGTEVRGEVIRYNFLSHSTQYYYITLSLALGSPLFEESHYRRATGHFLSWSFSFEVLLLLLIDLYKEMYFLLIRVASLLNS